DLAQRIEMGDIDLAIMPRNLASSKHPAVPLFSDTFVGLACAKNNGVSSQLTEADFRSASIVVSRYSMTRMPRLPEELWLSLGYRPHVALALPTSSMVPEYIAGTDLIAVVPSRLAKRAVLSMPLKEVTLPFACSFEEVLQWNERHTRDPSSRWFRDLII